MANPLQLKALANGTATDTPATVIYTVPAGKEAVIRMISLVNHAGGAKRVYYQINFGEGAVYVGPTDTIPDKAQEFYSGMFPLEEGDTVLLWAETAAVVDYVLLGSEDDAA